MNKHAGLMLMACAGLIFLAGEAASRSQDQAANNSPIAASSKHVAQAQSKTPRTSVEGTTSETKALAQITDYRHWTRANKKPQLELSYVAALCAPAPPAVTKAEKNNPHNDKYIVVYVNDKGKRALLHDVRPKFPIGTILVKEKRAEPDSATPELCTIMLKREAGYNSKGGDWEYFVTDGTGAHVQSSGKLANCASCHAKQKLVDYVFRHYLPNIAYRYFDR